MSGARIPGVELTLGDQKFVVPPLSLGDLETYGDDINKFDALSDGKKVTLIIDITHAAIKRNYPEMTRDDIKGLMSMRDMQAAFAAVMDVSELMPKGGAQGEAGAGSASTSMQPTATS